MPRKAFCCGDLCFLSVQNILVIVSRNTGTSGITWHFSEIQITVRYYGKVWMESHIRQMETMTGDVKPKTKYLEMWGNHKTENRSW